MFGDLDEVGGIRAVIATDDDHQVHRVAKHFKQRVLALLGRAADRVEHLECRVVAIALMNRIPDTALDLLGLALEHGGLICDADPGEMLVRIKSRRAGVFETVEKLCLVTTASNVSAYIIDIVEREDDQITSIARIAKCP